MRKKCSKCSKEFECKSLEGDCWCNEIKLSEDKLKQIEEDYPDCLCRECLHE